MKMEHRSVGAASECPDAATIAAFVDGALDPAGRARVVQHLASCVDCAELVGEVVRTAEELPGDARPRSGPDPAVEPPKGRILWMRRRNLAAVGGLVAIAASLLLLLLNRGSQLDPLVAIVGDERLIVARPTGGFRYGPLRSPVRGAGDTEQLHVAAEVARLRERADRSNAAADRHAYGVAQLVSGDAAGAISSLQTAARSKQDDPNILADLGAAYLTRFTANGDQADATAALASIDKALSLAPALEEALFNKALLLEQMERHVDALAAWTSYLERPGDPGWRVEAVRHRDRLQQRSR
jgi:tetratricopeptide (TPR) repeat protein